MQEKVCFKCKRNLPISEFYVHPQMGDGRLNKCKECTRSDVAANYQANREHYVNYEKGRFKQPDRKAKVSEYRQKRRRTQPLKYAAHTATGNAIRDGRLVRQPCEKCGAIEVEAHHDDYGKPLDVRWLCRLHHLEHHGKKAYVKGG